MASSTRPRGGSSSGVEERLECRDGATRDNDWRGDGRACDSESGTAKCEHDASVLRSSESAVKCLSDAMSIAEGRAAISEARRLTSALIGRSRTSLLEHRGSSHTLDCTSDMASAPTEPSRTPAEGSAPSGDSSSSNNFATALSTISPLEDLQRLPSIPCARYSLLFGIIAGTSVGALRFVFSRGTGAGGRMSEVGRAANWAVGAWGVGSLGAW